MLFEARPFDLTETHEPYFLFWIPSSSGRFGLFPRCVVRELDAHGHKRVVGISFLWRPPCRFLDDQFDGLGPGAARLVVPVTDANERLAVFVMQLLRSLLTGLELQTCYHSPAPT